MAKTVITGRQVRDGSVQREDIDITTSGQSLITKIATSGSLLSILSSTGADAGTGDVTLTITSPIPIGQGGTGQTTRQAAINALTDSAGSTNEHVLTKDTSTGHALFKTINLGNYVVPNDVYIKWRNVANSADINVLKVTTNDDTLLNSTEDIIFQTNSTARWIIDQANGYLRGQGTSPRIVGHDATNRSLLIAADSDSAAASYIQVNTDATQGGNLLLESGAASSASVTLGTRSSSGSINLRTNSITRWEIKAAGVLVHNTLDALIAASTTDGADNSSLSLAGGGQNANTRGGYINLYGNESGAGAGSVIVSAGNIATASISLVAPGTSGSIIFNINGTDRLLVRTDGNLYYSNSNFNLSADTTDGSDNKVASLTGGGTSLTTRGGYISAFGNEHGSNPGIAQVVGGNVTGGKVWLRTEGSQQIEFTTANVERARITASGNVGIGITNPGALLHVNGSFIAGNLLTSAQSTLSVAQDSTGWIKLCTIPSPGTTKIVYYAGSINSEEWGEIEIEATYFLSNTQISVKRHTYNHHLQEVRVTSTANGQPKVVYVRIRTTSAAPSIIWRLVNAVNNGTITIHNIEETPASGTSLDLPTTTVQNIFKTNSSIISGGILEASNDLIYSPTTFTIRSNSTDGSDDKRIIIAGGGAAGASRGAQIDIRGNEYVSFPGSIGVNSGDVSGAIAYIASNATDGFTQIQNQTGAAMWQVPNATGNFEQHVTAGGDIVFNKTSGIIRQGTFDGSDNKVLILCGGGAGNNSRGATILLEGNEANGRATINSGGVATSHILMQLGHSSALYKIQNNAGTDRWTVDDAGTVRMYDTAGVLMGTLGTSGSSGDIVLGSGNAASGHVTLRANKGDINFYSGIGSVNFRWAITSTGNIEQDASNGGDIVFNKTSGIIRQGTSDGSDNKQLQITGGGAFDITGTRGSGIRLSGNEDGSAVGNMIIFSGDTSSSHINLRLNNSSGIFKILGPGAAELWNFLANGTLEQNSTNGSDIIFNRTNGIIRQGTSDSSDTKRLLLCGGGGQSSSRGASIDLRGNEYDGSSGSLFLQTGDTGAIVLLGNGTQYWKMDSSGNLLGNATTSTIAADSSDGADSKRLFVCGGGAAGSTRGATIYLTGNEHANAGRLELLAGATGDILLLTNNTSRWKIDGSNGHLIPSSNNTYDVGESATRVKKIWVQDIDISGSLVGASGGMSWTTVTGTSQTMDPDAGYISNNASLVTLTLPSSCAVGKIIRVVGLGAGGWRIAQNSGQIIHIGDTDTTTGVSGQVNSTHRRDAIELICVVANTEFSLLSSVGTLDIV